MAKCIHFAFLVCQAPQIGVGFALFQTGGVGKSRIEEKEDRLTLQSKNSPVYEREQGEGYS
jgi:hypothetical protein